MKNLLSWLFIKAALSIYKTFEAANQMKVLMILLASKISYRTLIGNSSSDWCWFWKHGWNDTSRTKTKHTTWAEEEKNWTIKQLAFQGCNKQQNRITTVPSSSFPQHTGAVRLLLTNESPQHNIRKGICHSNSLSKRSWLQCFPHESFRRATPIAPLAVD